MDDTFTATLDGSDNDASSRQLRSPTPLGDGGSQPSSISALSRPAYRSPNGPPIGHSLEADDLAETNKDHSHVMLDGTSELHQPGQDQAEQQHLTARLFTESPASAHWPTNALPFGSAEPPQLSQTGSGNVDDGTPQPATARQSLPSRDVNEGTVEDAYVSFILYCNPQIPAPDDFGDLKKGFQNPPKSDGKSFSTWALFELIRKLENKEIKSWSQLALTLGVERPIAEKKQSAQKVQQYAVRLKRWMHAMHLDAFFAYCMSKPHSYYTIIPSPDDPNQEPSRDGVPREEDLALRALQPESRPKRGRRKADDKDGNGDLNVSPSKRPQIGTPSDTPDFDNFGGDSSTLFPSSAVPGAGQDEDLDRYTKQLDSWTETPTMTTGPINPALFAQSPTNRANSGSFGGQQFRWRLNVVDHAAPGSPYPQSAVTPATSHLPDSMFEPLSAITPVSGGLRGRGRRRHGPAVSSAWPTGGSTMTGKFRGRPPSNRSIRDGPFSTFPANPRTREGPVIDVQRNQVSTPVTAVGNGSWSSPLAQPASQQAKAGLPAKPLKRTSLQLHVPERKGGPVRLATPIGSVNGAGKDGAAALMNHSDDGGSDSEMFLSRHAQPELFVSNRRQEVVDGIARRLAQATLLSDVGLGSKEAKQLAEKALENIRYAYAEPVDDERFLADCASWFALQPDLQMGSTGPRSSIADLQVRRLMDGRDGRHTSNENYHHHPDNQQDGQAATCNNDLDLLINTVPSMTAATTATETAEAPSSSPIETGPSNPSAAGAALPTLQKMEISWRLHIGPLSAQFFLPVSMRLYALAAKQQDGSADGGEEEVEGVASLHGPNPTTNRTTTNNLNSSLSNGDNVDMSTTISEANNKRQSEEQDQLAKNHHVVVSNTSNSRNNSNSGNEVMRWKEKYVALQREHAEERARIRRAIVQAMF